MLHFFELLVHKLRRIGLGVGNLQQIPVIKYEFDFLRGAFGAVAVSRYRKRQEEAGDYQPPQAFFPHVIDATVPLNQTIHQSFLLSAISMGREGTAWPPFLPAFFGTETSQRAS
ncbi:hypothetical protein D3C87_1810680 [compost metagenome]